MRSRQSSYQYFTTAVTVSGLLWSGYISLQRLCRASRPRARAVGGWVGCPGGKLRQNSSLSRIFPYICTDFHPRIAPLQRYYAYATHDHFVYGRTTTILHLPPSTERTSQSLTKLKFFGSGRVNDSEITARL